MKRLTTHWEKIFSMHAAAAAAKSLQLCLTLCDPIDSRPPGSAPHHKHEDFFLMAE